MSADRSPMPACLVHSINTNGTCTRCGQHLSAIAPGYQAAPIITGHEEQPDQPQVSAALAQRSTYVARSSGDPTAADHYQGKQP